LKIISGKWDGRRRSNEETVGFSSMIFTEISVEKTKALYYNIDSRNLLKYLGGKIKWQQ
jgi:hypothetical protein